jgi:hypothetical protein
MEDILPLSIRESVPDDYGYILKTFTQELHKVHPYNFIPNKIFFPHYTELLNKILNTSTTVVSCLSDEPQTIAGYLIAEPRKDSLVIHWGATKGIFRRLGVLTSLLNHFNHQDKLIVCTHFFNLFKNKKDKYNLIFDPTYLEKYK